MSSSDSSNNNSDSEEEEDDCFLELPERKAKKVKFPTGTRVLTCRCPNSTIATLSQDQLDAAAPVCPYYGSVEKVGINYVSKERENLYQIRLSNPPLGTTKQCMIFQEQDLQLAPFTEVWLKNDGKKEKAIVLSLEHSANCQPTEVVYTVQTMEEAGIQEDIRLEQLTVRQESSGKNKGDNSSKEKGKQNFVSEEKQSVHDNQNKNAPSGTNTMEPPKEVVFATTASTSSANNNKQLHSNSKKRPSTAPPSPSRSKSQQDDVSFASTIHTVEASPAAASRNLNIDTPLTVNQQDAAITLRRGLVFTPPNRATVATPAMEPPAKKARLASSAATTQEQHPQESRGIKKQFYLPVMFGVPFVESSIFGANDQISKDLSKKYNCDMRMSSTRASNTSSSSLTLTILGPSLDTIQQCWRDVTCLLFKSCNEKLQKTLMFCLASLNQDFLEPKEVFKCNFDPRFENREGFFATVISAGNSPPLQQEVQTHCVRRTKVHASTLEAKHTCNIIVIEAFSSEPGVPQHVLITGKSFNQVAQCRNELLELLATSDWDRQKPEIVKHYHQKAQLVSTKPSSQDKVQLSTKNPTYKIEKQFKLPAIFGVAFVEKTIFGENDSISKSLGKKFNCDFRMSSNKSSDSLTLTILGNLLDDVNKCWQAVTCLLYNKCHRQLKETFMYYLAIKNPEISEDGIVDGIVCIKQDPHDTKLWYTTVVQSNTRAPHTCDLTDSDVRAAKDFIHLLVRKHACRIFVREYIPWHRDVPFHVLITGPFKDRVSMCKSELLHLLRKTSVSSVGLGRKEAKGKGGCLEVRAVAKQLKPPSLSSGKAPCLFLHNVKKSCTSSCCPYDHTPFHKMSSRDKEAIAAWVDTENDVSWAPGFDCKFGMC